MSLCQLLGLLNREELVVLADKHGLPTDDLAYQGFNKVPVLRALRGIITQASDAQIREILDEVARTHEALPGYPDGPIWERWRDLVLCLELDGYRLTESVQAGSLIQRFIPIEPNVGGLEKLDDDLALEIGRTELPGSQDIVSLIEASASSFRAQDFNSCLGNVRVALETLAKAIAKVRRESHPANFNESEWGSVIAYLRTSGFITDKQEKALVGVYGFISEGAHKPLGFEDHEFARLGRNFALGSCYFLSKRFNAKDD